MVRRRSGQTALADRRRLPAQIASGDFDIAGLGKLTATKLALRNHLEPGALEMKRLDAALGCRPLIKEVLEDAPADPHGTFVRPQDDGELDGVTLVVPACIFWKLEKQHLAASGRKEQNVLIMFQ
jgi:hypothetical protein